jgi:RMKL-like, methyltransferase domain
MTTIIAQVAPQRSTQYTNLARDLVEVELLASPLGRDVSDVAMETIAGQHYVKFKLPGPELLEHHSLHLAGMAMIGGRFELFESIGDVPGPLLRPIPATYPFFVSPDIAAIRRYKGKTNELFTQFLCNMAKYASDFSDRSWQTLRLLDPLCGGGTTLFVGLSLGCHVAGIEHNRTDVETTAAFIKQYCRENRIAATLKEERLKRLVSARRWIFTIGKDDGRQCLLVHGDAAQTKELVAGFGRPQLIVTDLPYGIQHSGPLAQLLSACLPAWAAILEPGGCIAFAWDATRTSRAEMIDLVQAAAPLQVVQQPPYDRVAHRVDRVIKRRDIIVAWVRRPAP